MSRTLAASMPRGRTPAFDGLVEFGRASGLSTPKHVSENISSLPFEDLALKAVGGPAADSLSPVDRYDPPESKHLEMSPDGLVVRSYPLGYLGRRRTPAATCQISKNLGSNGGHA